MKNSNDTIDNRTRNLTACIAVYQRTVAQRACEIGFIAVRLSGIMG